MFNRALTIKSDVNGLLDIARATFCEYVDLLEEYVQVIYSNHGTRKPYSKDDHFFDVVGIGSTQLTAVMDTSLPSTLLFLPSLGNVEPFLHNIS